MEAVGKAEELLDSEVPPKASEKQETAPDEDGPIELETRTQKDSVPTASDSAVLSSMPCLLMELRRDSSESQLASAESDKPTGGRVMRVTLLIIACFLLLPVGIWLTQIRCLPQKRMSPVKLKLLWKKTLLGSLGLQLGGNPGDPGPKVKPQQWLPRKTDSLLISRTVELPR